MSRTWYQVLDISREASPEQIARAFESMRDRLASSANPDPGEELAIHQAFDVLSNPQRRAVYDTQLTERRARRVNPSGAAEESGTARYKWLLAAVIALSLITWMVVKKSSASRVHTEVIEVNAGQQPAATWMSRVAPGTAAGQNPAADEGRRKMSAEELYAQIAPSVAKVLVSDSSGNPVGSGSGVVVGPREVITNCHVAKMGKQLELNIADTTIPATILKADEKYDLCLLRAEVTSKAIPIAHLDQVHTAQKVYAIGAPQGLELTISEGIVSSLREMSDDTGTVIQTTAPISPGSSGGGLFDDSGRLIGITTFQAKSGQNLNFAVPAEWIESMSDRTNEGGVGDITMNHGSGETNEVLQKIIGYWNCVDTVNGTRVDLNFIPRGVLMLNVGGKPGSGSYATDGTHLFLNFPHDTIQANIEELSGRKMVLAGGPAFKVTCTR